MDHAAACAAIPEVIARNRADDALKVCGSIQRITECRAVDVERVSIDDRNLLDGREQERRGVIAVPPVGRRWRPAKSDLETRPVHRQHFCPSPGSCCRCLRDRVP